MTSTEALDCECCVLQAGASSLDELAVHPVAFGFEITMHEPPS